MQGSLALPRKVPAGPPLGLWLRGAIHLISIWFSYLFVILALLVIFLFPGAPPCATRTLSAEGAAASFCTSQLAITNCSFPLS